MIAHSLPSLLLRGKSLLPVVQGGMGVGVSAHGLAGAVAAEGGVGTIASVDLRRLHKDLMARTENATRELIDKANLEALDREVKAALERARGAGVVAVNVMRAVSQYAELVRQACQSGANAIVVGAGLPLDLPELVEDFKDVALIPILSDARGVSLVVKRWMRKNRLPDAIVLEHPGWAGGHLGAANLVETGNQRFDMETVLPECVEALDKLGLKRGEIPLIAAGGINSLARIKELIGLGASGVQVGTAFAVTEESDAAPEFKRVLAEAKPEDVVEFMSVAGLPARAVRTAWLDRYLNREGMLQKAAECAAQGRTCSQRFDCLLQCGLRDKLAKFGQFCIDKQLAAAQMGDVAQGLFFRGKGKLPFGDEIRPVRELLEMLLTGRVEGKPA
ncbi:nitronate monooxygenase family protein [Uliginosibacterium sp. 31-16]|uniref:NAD(P)H-dependent flavin oxidoreductase n=1 Tax=Uliginosibacterium sp. 31-16 TaxID=3068315 RepID=UPI00273DACCB|nr:nitronate monooxygenase family protein [Uliginosibacterium sp. 31-16]MDP5239028.1 nitronate monooxygenase family protein [Uliginosibacterium sp. 31-16]